MMITTRKRRLITSFFFGLREGRYQPIFTSCLPPCLTPTTAPQGCLSLTHSRVPAGSPVMDDAEEGN